VGPGHISCHTCTELSQADWQVGRGPGQLPFWLDLVKYVDWAVTQRRWSPAMRFRPFPGDLVSALKRGLDGESTDGDAARKRSLEMADEHTCGGALRREDEKWATTNYKMWEMAPKMCWQTLKLIACSTTTMVIGVEGIGMNSGELLQGGIRRFALLSPPQLNCFEIYAPGST
jgi:hypothetical protein